MATTYLASMLVTAALALGVVLWIARGRKWKQYTPQIGDLEPGSLSQDGRALSIGFVVLMLAVVGIVMAVLNGGSNALLLGLAGGLVLAFLVIGTYAAGRSHGHPHAYAVGEATAVLGVTFLVVLTGWLVTNFGAS